MTGTTVRRTVFATPRSAEFLELRALHAQTGQPAEAFGHVVVKELLDNALDAAESADRAPVIDITVSDDDDEEVVFVTVSDNGAGITPEVVARLRDFTMLVSDKARYDERRLHRSPGNPTRLYVDVSVCPVRGAIVHDRQVHADWHAQLNPTRRNVTMTSVFKSDEDRQDCIEWVMQCYRDAESLAYQYPIGQLIDHAERLPEGTPPIRELIFSAPKEYLDTLPEEVVDGLKFLGTAAGHIVYDTPEILWAFAKAVGIDAEVTEYLDERDASDRPAEEDPDSPINRMRRRYQEMKQQS